MYDSTEATLEHIKMVADHGAQIMENLRKRYTSHDQSKLLSPEKETFDEYTPKLKDSTYGSEEYKGFLKGMGTALDHHYAENDHHPEHCKSWVCNLCFTKYKEEPESGCTLCANGTFSLEADISKMSLLSIMEMLTDWKAATLRHADGDIMKSLELNQKRFGYRDELKQILINTVEELKWK